VPVQVNASATDGIFSVQLYVDGAPYGVPDTVPIGPYRYELPWDTSTVTPGDHTLSVLATDWSLSSATVASAPITVDVGPAYPTIQLTTPISWTFVRGSVPISVSTTSAVGSGTVAFTVDGSPVASPWDTATAADGAHVVGATITDGRGKSATDAATVTVDNTPPESSLVSPAGGASFVGSMPVQAHASDAHGISRVQFAIDGTAVGGPITSPDLAGGYTYSAALDVSHFANGSHTLTSLATDNAGNEASSAAVTFRVGASPPTVTLTAPPDWSFARGVLPVTAAIAGGASPVSAVLLIDGVATGSPLSAGPYTFQWDTTKVADGAHALAVKVTDATGATVTSAVAHETVDNTAPAAVMYQPPANSRSNGPTIFQVHASDVNGVRSVQLTVDGKPVGALLSQPDAGQLYLYSITFDTSTIAPGSHTVSAVVTDNAGNTATPTSVPIKTGPSQYLPVINYHEINPTDGFSIYDQTLAEADQQLAYLKANGYRSVTLAQYQQWLAGADIGIAKPVLLTVDDGLNTDLAWDSLLQKYDFSAVMFVITGYADNTTPGDADSNNMSWSTIQALASNGRWEIAFHAGRFGHGDSYASGANIGGATYTTACPYFYTCLSQTVTGNGRNRKVTQQSVAAYETAVTNEVTQGLAELKEKVPTANLSAWAAPFNDAGQWTNLYNDATGQAQSWLPGFMASKFRLVFTQTNPVTYAGASGTVGSLTGFNRHYRFEVHTDTTVAQFATALSDAAFAR
jgi:hypothetical protein